MDLISVSSKSWSYLAHDEIMLAKKVYLRMGFPGGCFVFMEYLFMFSSQFLMILSGLLATSICVSCESHTPPDVS